MANSAWVAAALTDSSTPSGSRTAVVRNASLGSDSTLRSTRATRSGSSGRCRLCDRSRMLVVSVT
jgi:hypothetical protein